MAAFSNTRRRRKAGTNERTEEHGLTRHAIGIIDGCPRARLLAMGVLFWS
jgi:hypothetical protein